MGTGTTVDFEMTGSVYPTLLNEALAKVMYKRLQQVGGVKYNAEEEAFAKTLQQSLGSQAKSLDSAWAISPWQFGGTAPARPTSADVSWNVPTVQIGAATWVARHRGAFVAGRGRVRHEHRRQGDDGGREDNGADGGGPVPESGAGETGPHGL